MDRFSGLPFDEPRIGHIDPQDQDKKQQKARIEAVRGKAGRGNPDPVKEASQRNFSDVLTPFLAQKRRSLLNAFDREY